jgi:hypothetical protein
MITINKFGVITEENGKLHLTDFNIDANCSVRSSEEVILIAVINRLKDELSEIIRKQNRANLDAIISDELKS